MLSKKCVYIFAIWFIFVVTFLKRYLFYSLTWIKLKFVW